MRFGYALSLFAIAAASCFGQASGGLAGIEARLRIRAALPSPRPK